jgi:hypothetical protein
MTRVTGFLAVFVCLCIGAGWGSPVLGADSSAVDPEREALPSDPDRVPVAPIRPDGDPDAWCPSGRALDSYLAARESLPQTLAARGRTPAAPPVVTPMAGVLMIEDSGVILRNDRVFDLPMESIEFIPTGDGYEIVSIPLAYEPVTVPPLFTNASSWRSERITPFGFVFPFGGEDRTEFWVTSTNLIAFEPPSEPIKIGLCSAGCFFDEGQVLLDRLPRISPLRHGNVNYGWNVYVQEKPGKFIVTWQYDDPANLDVQVVLFADGRIRFNYAAVSGIEHGAVVVVTGNDDFWGDLRLGGDATDPAGDVTIPAPDGPGMDIVGATARQVGTSELLHVEFTLAAPPPAVSEVERIFYQIQLRDSPFDPEPLGSVIFQWQRGLFYWMSEPAKLEGTTLKLNLRLSDLPLSGDNLHLTFKTFRGDAPYEQGDQVELTADFAPPSGRLMLDLSADLPVTSGNEPVYEAFTLPALQPGEVLEALAPLFEDPSTVEAFAIFQNLQTDLFFFGGGYHAGGNSGADGVGFGSSSVPRSPSLLHLNNIYGYYWQDEAMMVLNHELGHRWLYHFAIEEEGIPSRILNPISSHPAGWVHTPAVRPVYRPLDYSVMGGSNWNDNGDGTFTSPTEEEGGANGYTWHELYLMGLADPAEVAAWGYLRDPVPPLPSAYWAPNGVTVSASFTPVQIDQVIAVEGPRFPAYPDTPQFFLTPVVLVVRPGEYLQEELDTVDAICTLWEPDFSEATDFRGSLRCRFDPPVVDITTPAADVNVFAGDTIDFEGSFSDADGDTVELRWDFSGVAPDTTGEGPHPVTFATTGTYPVRLDGVDETGMLAMDDDAVLVTVECPSTPPVDSVTNLRLDRESGKIRFTWTDLSVPPPDYVVLGGDALSGSYLPQGSEVSGAPGLLLPEPAGNVFYQVAARNEDGCLGPY